MDTHTDRDTTIRDALAVYYGNRHADTHTVADGYRVVHQHAGLCGDPTCTTDPDGDRAGADRTTGHWQRWAESGYDVPLICIFVVGVIALGAGIAIGLMLGTVRQ